MAIYELMGVRPVINARSYSTKLGGGPLSPAVLEAMREAACRSVRMDELQDAAGRAIAEATGAETGIVTSGASAALTLAAAACIAGSDVEKMNRLPDTTGMASEIVVHRSHRNDYDHALRAAGARLVEVGFSYFTHPYEVESAIGPNTVAVFYHAGGEGTVMPLAEYAAIAHQRGIPVIVDAAAELPPPENLRALVAAGADLVAFSGGKHIGGPQASGILAGPKRLILSAALQHQDMDVFASTWPLKQLLADGTLAGPPHHGIGRGFKAGKEEIAGLVAALDLYGKRDFEAERRRWMAAMETITAAVSGAAGVTAEVQFPQPGGRTVPHAVLRVNRLAAGHSAVEVVNALQTGDPRIFVFEQGADRGMIRFMPECLGEGEEKIIAGRLREIFRLRG